MKKTVTITLIMLLLASAQGLKAQIKPFVFGLKAAPNAGWLQPDQDYYKFDGSKIGINWGFIAEFNLTYNYAIQTGFNVISSGGKLKYPHIEKIDGLTKEGFLHRDYTLKYIEIPIALKMRTKEFNSGLKYWAKIGFGAGVRVKAEAKDLFKYENKTQSTKGDIKDDINLLRAALLIGAGIEYDLGHSVLLIGGVNFNNGFTDVLDGNNARNPELENRARLNMLELNIGIIF